MEESIKWDDGRDEIMNIVDKIDNIDELDLQAQVPFQCPICDMDSAHIYMHRFEGDRGTIWTWCSHCKSCMHGSRMYLPDWWENDDFIVESELTSHPIFLEPKADRIDEYLRMLLEKRKLSGYVGEENAK